MHRDFPARQNTRQCSGDLSTPSTAQTDEDDVERVFAGAGERSQSLPREPMRQHGQEVLDLRLASEPPDRVLHHGRYLRRVEAITELGDQRLRHLLDVMLSGREDRTAHSSEGAVVEVRTR